MGTQEGPDAMLSAVAAERLEWPARAAVWPVFRDWIDGALTPVEMSTAERDELLDRWLTDQGIVRSAPERDRLLAHWLAPPRGAHLSPSEREDGEDRIMAAGKPFYYVASNPATGRLDPLVDLTEQAPDTSCVHHGPLEADIIRGRWVPPEWRPRLAA